MKRKISMLAMTFIAAVLLMLVLSKYKRFFYPSDLALAEGMDELKEKSQAGLDSTMQRINAENALFDSVKTLIGENKLHLADKILDSAINANPSQYIYRTYKGMVFAAKGDDSAAIKQYNESMSRSEFPLALSHRAQSYLRQKNNLLL